MSYPLHQPRRLRRTQALRDLVQETRLHPSDLIYPLFIVPGNGVRKEINAMPGQYLYSVDMLAPVIEQLKARRVYTVLLFGQADVKDSHGHSAHHEDACVLEAVRYLKKNYPEFVVITDICLCSYTEHGHCGPLKEIQCEKIMDNAETLAVLRKVALKHAEAGADILAPSGMVDGVVGALREALDQAGFDHVAILSYAIKYASSFYGPFREAADSSPREGDRRGYQMNPANRKEALLEAALDVEEGADILMVKPGLPYLDVLSDLVANFDLPVFAYQVSGEYSMIKAAAQQGWLDEKKAVHESLLAMKRAGASAIISYFAACIDVDSL